jgi:hypothetical protein
MSAAAEAARSQAAETGPALAAPALAAPALAAPALAAPALAAPALAALALAGPAVWAEGEEVPAIGLYAAQNRSPLSPWAGCAAAGRRAACLYCQARHGLQDQ